MAPDNYDNYEAELVDLEQREVIRWRVLTDIEKKLSRPQRVKRLNITDPSRFSFQNRI